MGLKDIKLLADLNKGSIEEQFGRELPKVLANIADPSTAAKKVRKISIEIAIQPSANRDSAKVSIVTKSTLAPVAPDEDFIFLENTSNGVVAMSQEPERQLELENVLPMSKEA